MRGQLRPEWAPTRSHQRGVEVGELTNHDDKFDEWLESQVMATTFTVEESVQIAATPENVFPDFTDPVRYVQWMGTEGSLSRYRAA